MTHESHSIALTIVKLQQSKESPLAICQDLPRCVAEKVFFYKSPDTFQAIHHCTAACKIINMDFIPLFMGYAYKVDVLNIFSLRSQQRSQ